MKKVYVAASFAYADKDKTNQRKSEIEEVVREIQSKTGEEVSWYLPHQLKIENAWDISLEEWSQKVFEHDLQALLEADLVIFISYGKENNAGAVWEVGYATAKGIQTVVVKMTNEVESLMITQSVHSILTKEEITNYDWVNLPKYKTKLEKLS